jgi:hypothetical protein
MLIMDFLRFFVLKCTHKEIIIIFWHFDLCISSVICLINSCEAKSNPKHWQFVFAKKKKKEFCMILCRVTLDGQLWPSISSLSQFSFAQYFFHVIHIINKAWYLDAILQKLVIMKAAQKTFNWAFNGGDFPFLNQILFF